MKLETGNICGRHSVSFATDLFILFPKFHGQGEGGWAGHFWNICLFEGPPEAPTRHKRLPFLLHTWPPEDFWLVWLILSSWTENMNFDLNKIWIIGGKLNFNLISRRKNWILMWKMFWMKIVWNDVVGGGKYETSGGHISGTSYCGCKAAKGHPTTRLLSKISPTAGKCIGHKVEGLKYLYDDTCHADSHLAAVSAQQNEQHSDIAETWKSVDLIRNVLHGMESILLARSGHVMSVTWRGHEQREL